MHPFYQMSSLTSQNLYLIIWIKHICIFTGKITIYKGFWTSYHRLVLNHSKFLCVHNLADTPDLLTQVYLIIPDDNIVTCTLKHIHKRCMFQSYFTRAELYLYFLGVPLQYPKYTYPKNWYSQSVLMRLLDAANKWSKWIIPDV